MGAGDRVEYFPPLKKKEILSCATNPECILHKIRHKKTTIMLTPETAAVTSWWENYDIQPHDGTAFCTARMTSWKHGQRRQTWTTYCTIPLYERCWWGQSRVTGSWSTMSGVRPKEGKRKSDRWRKAIGGNKNMLEMETALQLASRDDSHSYADVPKATHM